MTEPTGASATRPADRPVLGIGELLWDLFPDGPRLGGAPFNVVANLRRLGHPTAFVSAVGDDELGRRAIEEATRLEVDASLIAVSPHLPTGTVTVDLGDAQSHRFAIGTPAAYEAIRVGDDERLRIDALAPAGMVFGTLAQQTPSNLAATRAVLTAHPDAHRLYDVNLRDGTWTPELVRELLALATTVKLNEPEAAVVARVVGSAPGAAALGERLADEGVAAVCVTRGPAGAELWRAGQLTSVGGIRVAVVDTVGAGDAFAAGLLHGFLLGWPSGDVLAFANRLGALVASRRGALPDWRPDELGRG